MNHKLSRSLGAVSALAFVLAAACQPAATAEIAAAPAPAGMPAGHQHTPGMTMDTARARPAGAGHADSAMHRMMQQMDPDTRFMHHMTMHHAQALEMVALVPSRAASPRLRLLSERIDISQKDEIALMRRWLEKHGKPLPPEGAHAMHMTMPGMLTDAELARLRAATGSEFERLFLELMIKHHEGALTMVAELLGSQGAAQDSEMFRLVSDIEADQRAEIDRMRSMLRAMGARPPG